MKNKIITYSFLIYILVFAILHIAIKDEEYSKTERRTLQTFPSFTFTNTYITKVDKYLLDNFPFRDTFRSIKANYNYHILNKYDNNGIYLKDNYIYKSNYPTDEESIDKFINHINKMQSLFTNSNYYIMVIPDKNYYLNDDKFLQIDYNYIYNKVDNLTLTKIDIRDIMTYQDYYETDTHWKMENLFKVVQEMSNSLDFSYEKEEYTSFKYDKFYGVYYGLSAIKRSPETLTYLRNNSIDNAYVTYLENKNLHDVYNLSKLNGLDAYQVYLDGSSSFIEIDNKITTSDKELIIFRDSFGSSLIPLLINYYKKITVIDNRYISSNNFTSLINKDKQDVLFLYSTLLINDSNSLKN